MVFMYIASIAEQAEIIKQHEKEIYDMKVSVMVSQIGPHFIYNTLSTIKHLCRVNPALAAETVDEFAAYLRGNIESLTGNSCIPFSQELEHVKNYLAIEKKRFGGRVNAEYDIQAEEFLIPPLSLQPIVENAVKHGLIKREEGGMVKIASSCNGISYIIEISDDGVGFDVKQKKNDGRKHIGIQNVRDRIKDMCNGSVTVESIIGEGTKVNISIPVKEKSI